MRYYVFSSFSLLYLSSSFKNCAFGFITFGLSPLHFGQYHLPFGLVVRVTQEKWNHSMGHKSLSHIIISPYEIWSHKQYVGSSGSASSSRGGDSSLGVVWLAWRAFRFFFLPFVSKRAVRIKFWINIRQVLKIKYLWDFFINLRSVKRKNH